MGGQAHQELLFLREVQTQYGVEREQDPSGLTAIVVIEVRRSGVVDEAPQQRGQVEDLLVGAAHRGQRVVATDTVGDLGVDV